MTPNFTKTLDSEWHVIKFLIGQHRRNFSENWVISIKVCSDMQLEMDPDVTFAEISFFFVVVVVIILWPLVCFLVWYP